MGYFLDSINNADRIKREFNKIAKKEYNKTLSELNDVQKLKVELLYKKSKKK